MKRYILLLLLATFTLGLAAQKAERKAIRSGNDSYGEQLYGNAEEEYKQALEVNAASKEASYNLANTFYKQQRWDDALKEYQHYLTLEQEDAAKLSAAWANVGNSYLKKKGAEKGQQQGQQGQQKGADNLQLTMEAYKRSLRLNPTDEDVRYNLAVVQKMIEDQGDGGGDDKDNKDEKKDDKKEDKKDEQQQQKQDQQKDKQQQEGQMSQDNVEQILKAMEQEEKETQERVKQIQADQRKRQNMHNRQQNKDW